MQLNIYAEDKKTVAKTYTADTYDLFFGTVEDLAKALKLDNLQTGTNAEIMKAILDLTIHSMDTVKDLLKDIFEGLTNEELRFVKVNDMATVLFETAQYAIKDLFKLLPTRKN